MNIAFVAFDGMTHLDFAGVYDPLCRLGSMNFVEGLRVSLCARSERVTTGEGLRLAADLVEPNLGQFDLVVVPGGLSTRQLIDDVEFCAWIASARDSPVVASVCTGSLLLGAAGLLAGGPATTHPAAADLLKKYAGEVLSERIVDAGPVITAGGVAASIDLGLYLCERIAGRRVREQIAEQMDYPYYRQLRISLRA